jgi:hypothetical protein
MTGANADRPHLTKLIARGHSRRSFLTDIKR